MKSVKHLVQGPFDIAQAIRELAAAIDELNAEEKAEKPAPKAKKATASK